MFLLMKLTRRHCQRQSPVKKKKPRTVTVEARLKHDFNNSPPSSSSPDTSEPDAEITVNVKLDDVLEEMPTPPPKKGRMSEHRQVFYLSRPSRRRDRQRMRIRPRKGLLQAQTPGIVGTNAGLTCRRMCRRQRSERAGRRPLGLEEPMDWTHAGDADQPDKPTNWIGQALTPMARLARQETRG